MKQGSRRIAMITGSIKRGIKQGIDTTLLLAKVVIPVYMLVTVLSHTPVMAMIAEIFKPLMALFNLPGEAAIVLVLGNCLNFFAALGAMSAINLTAPQITTIALMLSFSHALFMETAVVKMLGVNEIGMTITRLAMSFLVGIIAGNIGGVLQWLK